MGHPRSIINPLWGVRLKQVCAECNITQAELAKRVFITQQTISKIMNGRASLTLPTAQRIIGLFPQYRIEWLTGVDNFKTLDDLIGNRVDAQHETVDLIKKLMQLHGFTWRVEDVEPDINTMSKAERAEYEKKPYTIPRYSLRDAKGNARYFRRKEEVDVLFAEISKYVFFKCWGALNETSRDWLFLKEGNTNG